MSTASVPARCPHFPGTVVGPVLPEPITVTHTYCPHCRVWVRRDTPPPAAHATRPAA